MAERADPVRRSPAVSLDQRPRRAQLEHESRDVKTDSRPGTRPIAVQERNIAGDLETPQSAACEHRPRSKERC
jgi:hypothetical protein